MQLLFHLPLAFFFQFVNCYFESRVGYLPWHHGDNRNALKVDEYKWPNGVIPYAIDDSIPSKYHLNILKSFAVFDETCVKFTPKLPENHDTYIRLVKHKTVCTSTIGYRANRTAPLDVHLSNWCLNRIGAIQHELMHVMGIAHEQCRPDRDNYITILWDNVREENYFDFTKMPADHFDSYDIPYDFNSLMHYPQNAFAKPDKNITMFANHDPNLELGQYKAPTDNDLEKVRRMYNCPLSGSV